MVWPGLATGKPSAKLLNMKDVQYRSAGPEDFTFLASMLGEAAVWRPDKPTPTAGQVLADPRYSMYLVGWPRLGDHGLIAEQDAPVGAAWYRTYTEASHGYGFVAEDIPELSIAVVASRRHEGIGRRLLVDLDADHGKSPLSIIESPQVVARGGVMPDTTRSGWASPPW